MINKELLKTYEIILFIIAFPFFIFQILSIRFEIFIIICNIGFPILLALYIVWIIFLKKYGNENLTNFEILIFLLLIGVIFKIILIIYNLIGLVGYTVFGLWLEDFLAIIAIIFISFAFILLCIYAVKNSNIKELKLKPTDKIILIFGVLLLIILILYLVIL